MSLRLVLRWPLLAALLLAAFAVVLVSFEARPLQAQDPDIRLVNNRNVSGNASNSNDLRAQNFRTGANPDGYTISAVLIRLGSNSANKSTTVKIREHVPRENELTPARPGELVATLTSPTSLVSGDNTFTAPGGTTLAASTTYWITIGEGILKQNRAAVVPVTGDGQSGEPGWTIGNNSINRDSETDDWGAPQSSSLRMEIRGFIAADATLSGLALEADYDASKLVPVFASDIFDYTAKVAGRNDAVTLTATATQSTMTVAITSDADSGTPDEAVLALKVGSNTLTVTVTSEDGSGTRIYTITATRSEPPTAVPHDWDLIPNGRAAGDEFRLIFLSSHKRKATDTDIESYNTWIQDLLLDHGHSAIQDYRSGFRVVGCTADVDARDNIDTTDFRGVHIYWLNGAKVANGYAGFYNGSWDDEANNRNQSGTDSPDTSIEQNFPYTGCRQNGTEMRAGGNLRALGSANVRVGRPDNDTDDVGPIDGGVNHAAVNLRPIYGISQIFVVGAEGEVSTDARLSALTVNDGTSDLTLRPSFAPGTTAYAADVGATVTSVTLTPTTSDADATIEYLDGDDNALSPAVPFQFDLVVGENTIKMRVKATDDFTTRTYTLQVSRNTPATGAPHINGVAVVGQMLSASTTGISDVDGMTKADNGRAAYAYTYQWERVDADGTSNGLNIAGATEQTYTVIGADVGRKIRVQVSFSDDTGNPEGPLVSDAFPSSRTVTCADIWCATLNVQPLDSGAVGCANSSAGDLCSDEPQLSEDEFRHASTDYSVTSVNVQSNGQLQFWLGEPIAAGSESLVLHVGSEMFAFQEADVKDESSRLWNNSGLTWTDGDAVELKLTLGASIDSTDATLSALTVNDGTIDLMLRPSFAPGTQDYAADVGNAIDTVTLTATVNHSGARVQSVTLDGTPIADTDFSDGITVPSLDEGANVIAVSVTAEDGTQETYTITVTRAVPSSTDATLSALTVNDGTSNLMLTPIFAPGTLDYAADVGAAIDTVTLTATVNHSGARVQSVTLDGTPIADTDFSDGITVPSLVEDANAIAVIVTAEDGTQKTYTITVTRAAPLSTDATLSALTVNDGSSDLTLTPSFAPDTSGYAADVDAAIDTVTLTATVNHSGASVTSVLLMGNSITDTDFSDGITVPSLAEGENVIAVSVTAEDGTQKTYTITVTRAAPLSTDATLSALTVNDGTIDLMLTPSFAPGTSGYAADVGAAIDTVTLTATVNHSGASVTRVLLKGNDIVDTDFSDGITVPSLVEGANAISVIVTAEDGTQKTYTITVTRAVPPSTDATLSALTVNDGASDLTLRPSFAPDTLGYAADVDAAIDTVTLTATVNHSGASVTSVLLMGNSITDTDFSDGITVPSLVEDANVIAVSVTAEDGSQKTYTITVTRAVPSSTDATLSALTVNDGTSDLMLTPSFAPGTSGYAADVGAAIDTVTLTATVNHSGASVTSVLLMGNDIVDTDFSDGITVSSLDEGANAISVIVTAEDGTQKTYTITVTRAPSTPTVSIAADKTSAVFKQEGITYTLTRSGSTTAALPVTVTLTQTKEFLATAELSKTVTIAVGQSTKTFTVAASSFQHFAVGTLVEGGTLTAAVQDATDYELGTPSSVDVSIVIGMTVRFDLASYSVGEAAGPLSFKMIARTGAGAPQPTADYGQGEVGTDATNGTATQGTDFDQFGASLNFPVGDFSANGGVWQAELTFSITINEDALDEDDETFDILLERGQSSASISVVDASGNSCGSVCTVTVTIDDDNTAGVTVSKSALTVTEQDLAGATYTVVLDSQPTENVTISIGGQAGTDVSAAPSPLIFTPMNWDTAQTVTVTAANDAGTTNDVVALTHSGVSSDTNYQGITIAGLEVNITDNDTANLVVSPSMLSVGEAGSGDFTVKLATQPSADVSVSVSSDDTGAATVSPASLSFTTANWDTTQTVTVRGVDDPDTAEESVTVSLSATGGGYGSKTASVTVTITDDDTANLVVSESTLNVGEAGSGDFTVKLATQPSAGVSVSVSSGDTGAATVSPASLSFTTANWDTTQTVTVSGVDDPDTAEESVTVSLSATGGGYGSKTASVMVTITDDDTANLVVSEPTLSVGEAGSGDFTVKLATQPSAGVSVSVSSGNTGAATVSPASLSFTTADWDMAQTVTVSGVDDPDTADESVMVSLSATGGGYVGKTASVTVTIDDDDTANLVVSESTLSVGEAGSGDFTVKLATQPSADVSVSVLSDDMAAATVSPASLSFTTANWDTTQTVTVRGVDDPDTADESVMVSLSATGGGYVGKTASVSVSVMDDDTANLVVSASTLSVGEAGSGDFTVKLATQPSADVSVSVSSDDTGAATVSPASLSFTAADWDMEQTVTVSGVDDPDTAEESVTVSLSAMGGGYGGQTASVIVSVTDNDDPVVTVSFKESSYSVAESDDNTTPGVSENQVIVTVTLSADPERTIIIPLTTTNEGGASGQGETDADYSGVPDTVTFVSGGETEKSFTFSAAQDSVDDDDESVTIGFKTSDSTWPLQVVTRAPDTTTVSITDDDTRGITVAPTSLRINEGGTGRYTVVLDSEPTANVTVTIGAPTNTDITVSETSLLFTPSTWKDEQTVTVSALQESDPNDDADDTDTITHLVSSVGDYATVDADPVAVTVIDDEDPQVKVEFDRAADTVEEGDNISFNVTLSKDPERTIIIPISVTHHDGAISDDYSLSATSLTFDAGVVLSKQITLTAVDDMIDDDGESVTVGFGDLVDGVSPGAVYEVTVGITDNDDPDVEVRFDADAYDVREGDGVMVTVRLDKDPERTVTIPITTSSQDASPQDYSGVPDTVTFDSGGEMEKTFTFSATQDSVDDDDESVTIGFNSSDPSWPSQVATVAPDTTTVRIGDDDDPDVEVNFKETMYAVDEGDTVEVMLTLSADPERTIIIPLTTTNEDGASGQGETDADYSGVPDTVTFDSGGEMEKSFTFSAMQDSVDDDDEFVIIGFKTSDPTWPSQVTTVAPDTTTVSITDDDVPDVEVRFDVAAYDVREGDGVMVTVKLDKDPERTVMIPITTSDQGALPQDYSGVPVSMIVTFASGETEKSFPFNATQDSEDDDDESVIIGFNSSDPSWPSQVATVAPDTTTVRIGDDDDPDVEVNFKETMYAVDEGDTVEVMLTLSADPERTIIIPLTTTNEDGASGQGETDADYSGVPDTVTFVSGGETEKSFTFSAAQDSVDDDDESVIIGFKTSDPTWPSQVTTRAPDTTTVRIGDDDYPNVEVNFEQPTYAVDEGDTVEVMLTLSADPERTVTIPITTTNQGGVSSSDYGIVPSTLSLTFMSGETGKSLTFSAADDDIDDDGESVKFELGATLLLVTPGTTTAATVSITDDDTRGVTVALPSALTSLRIDEGSTGRYTVVLDSEPTANVTVTIGAPTNTDITVSETSLLFTPSTWKDEQTVTVSALQESDPNDDADDTGTITHSVSSVGDYAAVGADPVAVTVIDDEDPQVKVEFDRTADTVEEGDAISFNVTLSKDPERTITIPIRVTHHDGAISDDYTLSPTSLTFVDQGVLSQQVMLTAVDDMIDDDDESVTLGFGDLVDGVSPGVFNEVTVGITDNDDPDVEVRFEFTIYTIDEGESFSINVLLNADPERPLTVPIKFESFDSAVGNYGLPVNVTFSEGVTKQSIDFTATNDDVDDDDGHVIVRFDTTSLDNVTAVKETIVSITDDDQRSVSVTATTLTVDEGISESYEVVLGSEPTANVTVMIDAPTNTDITVDSMELIFTPSNWDEPQEVTVTAADDPDAEEDTGTITHAVSGGDYDSVGADEVSVTVDDDEVSVSFEHAEYSVMEGGDAVTVIVRLNAPAKEMFTIDLVKTEDGATEEDYSGLPDQLMFDPLETEQSFGFSALRDAQADDGESVLLGFGTLPPGVIAGSPAQAKLTISDVVIRSTVTGGGGGGGGGPPPVPVPSDADFDWNVTRDIESLDPDHDLPTDIWSDGKTLWVLQNSATGADAVFAYDSDSGERQRDREFELDRRNRFSHGIWSDGARIWVADSGQDTLFAYDLARGERLADRDIELAEGNRDPRGIWSDGETINILDSVKDALFAYNLESGELVAEYALDKLNQSPRGIWSDGVTIWVSDDGAKRLFAYRIEQGALVRYEDEEFTFRSLLKAGNGDARGIWSDGDVIYVADEQDDKLYSYNLPDAINAHLATLSLSGIEIGEFSPLRTTYEATAGASTQATAGAVTQTTAGAATQTTAGAATQTTVSAQPKQDAASISIVPADADAAPGHQVRLAGLDQITVTVTSADSSRTRVYRVRLEPALSAVNQAPAASAIAPLNLTEGGDPARLRLAEYFNDADGDQLVYRITGPLNTEVATATLADGVVSVTPAGSGRTSFVLTANDGALDSEARTVAVTVTAAPTAAQAPAADATGESSAESSGGDMAVEATSDMRIAARNMLDGRVEFTIQQRAADASWGERLLPRARFLAADVEVGRWLYSSAVGVTVGDDSLDLRIAARRLADGRVEFAVQRRAADGSWSGLLLPSARFLPVESELGRWRASSAVDADSALSLNLRIAARRVTDGRVEFAVQQQSADGAWSELNLPSGRFLPVATEVGRWLASSAVNVGADDAGAVVRIAARRLADDRVEFAVQQRTADGGWGERTLPRSRILPVGFEIDRWLASSALAVSLADAL